MVCASVRKGDPVKTVVKHKKAQLELPPHPGERVGPVTIVMQRFRLPSRRLTFASSKLQQ